MLNTEQPSSAHPALDTYATQPLVCAFIDDQLGAVRAVQAASAQLALAVDLAAQRLGPQPAGTPLGRLIYVGAGTSGRLGLLDSVELYPTFSWPSERAIALLAGGTDAIYRAIEGAEDDAAQGGADVDGAQVSAQDVVIALAASGSTPYAMGALARAKALGALTIGIANNPGAPVVATAQVGITLDTGAEVISGSTRLKAGTAQKIALNAFSSAVMVRLHKVYGNLMVDVKPTNAKLIQRSVTLTVLATQASAQEARAALEACDFSVKTAIVMLQKAVDATSASALLQAHNGNVRATLATPSPPG